MDPRTRRQWRDIDTFLVEVNAVGKKWHKVRPICWVHKNIAHVQIHSLALHARPVLKCAGVYLLIRSNY